MRSCAFTGVLLGVSFAFGVAGAADLTAYKAPPPVPRSAAPVVFYGGLSLGARWSDTDWTTAEIRFPLPFTPANPASFDSTTARVGGYIGAMWRIAPTWVVGIEGDIAWGDSSKTIARIPGTCSLARCADIASVKENWDGSIRGRVGFLLTPPWLLYATGGITWQGLDINASCSGNDPSFCGIPHSESVSKIRAGWTLGTGVEVCLWRDWLVRLEYRFADYSRLDHTFFASAPGDRFVMNESLKTNTLLVGFAYKLDPADTRH